MGIELKKGDGGIYVLKMDNGENRFNPTSVGDINSALDEVERAAMQGPTALVITGHNKFFSNGLDLDWLSTQKQEAQKDLLRNFELLLARVVAFPCSTVAAINGHAFAGGCMFALACDYRVMRTERGYMCTNEIELGMPLTEGMNDLISSKVSPLAFREMLFVGRRYPAEDAKAHGLVDQFCPVEELTGTAVSMVEQFARHAGGTQRNLKADYYKAALKTLGTAFHPAVARL